MTEFLPLCDVLFNVISLAGYFCDVVFDVVLGYALFEHGRIGYFTIVLCLVLSSLIVSQIVSLRWYWREIKRTNIIMNQNSDSLDKRNISSSATIDNNKPEISVSERRWNNKKTIKIQRYAVLVLHVIQLGVLWRYAKLFVPVDLRRVKHEVRDLCMLRLVHAFCEAAPMLLLQLYLLITIQSDNKFLINLPELKLKSLNGNSILSTVSQVPTSVQQQTEKTFKDLNIVSAALSLFSVCWALASFSKNVRLQNVHRLVLTWLGVIFQFLWRLGTVTSRIASLTVYASFYNYWVFLVIILHWFSMFLWLISPKNVFHGEHISKLRKTLLSALIAFVYIFAYINLQELNHRQKMITFYIVMFLENFMLVCLWLVGVWPTKPVQWYLIPLLIFSTFVAGMIFMVLYYSYFHIRRLGYEAGGQYSGCINENIDGANRIKSSIIGNSGQMPIAGVFNCRFSNPVGSGGTTKRKKKKPTTFIPPPTLGYTSQMSAESLPKGPMEIAFWKRPLPRSQGGGSSENESSVGSRINIHQKLQEKKQKQLAELKIIEEEIKQGKLGGPVMNNLGLGDDGRTSLPRQPIPRAKKHINLDPMEWCSDNNQSVQEHFNNVDEMNNLNKFSSQYDQIYSSFGFTGINIPTIESNNIQNISIPHPSSQISTENNSLTRQVLPRSKILHTAPRNPFAENYRNILSNQTNKLNIDHNRSNSPVRNNGVFDHLNHQNIFLEIKHPRQISGTYSSSVENGNHINENKLPFPYNVVPPPRSKIDSQSTPPTPSVMIQQSKNQTGIINSKFTQRNLQRAKTPEILLVPHYLDNSRVYYDWIGRETNYRTQEEERNNPISSGEENVEISAADDSIIGATERSGNRNPSDIDSQVSLPRSYTLPREFRYYRRAKSRKFVRNEQFIMSTNSSDGDVDSADDNESERHSDTSQCHLRQQQQQQQQQQNPRIFQNKNYFNHSTNAHQLLCHHNNFISSSKNESTRNNNVNSSERIDSNNVNNSINYPNAVINNLDLIRGADSGNFNNFPNRLSRYRFYGPGKHTLAPWKHETKL